jgi:hypothetical protein
MKCKNHPEVEAVDRCAGCAESFCGNCLVEIQSQKYGAACKTMALRGAPPMVEEATIPCKEADEALKYAIVGLFCCGIILEPVAISKAMKARQMMALNPRLTGSGKATAALIIAIIGFLLWILAFISRMATMKK